MPLFPISISDTFCLKSQEMLRSFLLVFSWENGAIASVCCCLCASVCACVHHSWHVYFILGITDTFADVYKFLKIPHSACMPLQHAHIRTRWCSSYRALRLGLTTSLAVAAVVVVCSFGIRLKRTAKQQLFADSVCQVQLHAHPHTHMHRDVGCIAGGKWRWLTQSSSPSLAPSPAASIGR